MQNLSRAAFITALFLLALMPVFGLTEENHNLLNENSTNASFEPTAVFKRCWVEYNVNADGRKGMKIHVEFEVTGLKGVDSKIVVRVQREDNEFLMSKTAYSNDEGQLETSYSMKPGYPTTVYEDAEMFLPYNELNLRRGEWNLKLDIDLSYENGEFIQHLGYKNFKFTAPGFAADDAERPEASAKVNRVWIDYDVFENRKKGMRVHVNFEVTGLKNIDSKLTARVRTEDDEFLTSDSAFSNERGELEISFEMKPGYATTVYKDATMFLPYNEINLGKGVWNLKLDIDLNYANGEIIDHLAYHEFEFTR